VGRRGRDCRVTRDEVLAAESLVPARLRQPGRQVALLLRLIDAHRCHGTIDRMPKLLPVVERPTASCCAPLATAPLSMNDAKTLAGQLKALADPARLRLLSLMLAKVDFEACTCDLTGVLNLSQPTVSHHLKKLSEAGIVYAQRREGPWTYYRVAPDALRSLAAVIAPPNADA
jgi:ArsR family transcriptional regulator, arsenate/arsenite/antimonite-responsive transcriptional repressor